MEEACSGLFPPMVQKILIVNVPRMFSPIWSVIKMMLPEQHKVRLITTHHELMSYFVRIARPLDEQGPSRWSA